MNNSNFTVKVEICSEAIFTNGESEGNLVQSVALTDAHGFVYFHAKTLKGQLKRQAFWLLDQYASIDALTGGNRSISFLDSIIILFGINKEENDYISERYQYDLVRKNEAGILKISNLELDKKIRDYFIALQQADEEENYYRISPHDLIEAQTHIRTGIEIEKGIAKDKMLNTYHTVREGLIFYSDLIIEEDLRERHEMVVRDLQRIICSFRRIGAGIHRGRGLIKTELIPNYMK